MYKTYQRGKEKWSLVLSFTDDKGFRKQDSSFSDTDSIRPVWCLRRGETRSPCKCLTITCTRQSNTKVTNSVIHRFGENPAQCKQNKERNAPNCWLRLQRKGNFIFFHYTGTTCATVSCIRSPNMRQHRLRGLGSGGQQGLRLDSDPKIWSSNDA